MNRKKITMTCSDLLFLIVLGILIVHVYPKTNCKKRIKHWMGK